MSEQAQFTLRGRNPDVLTCIANLSNDEVFTPPELANRMLDSVAEAWAASHGGANIWADKNVRFLDPCTKSGVFLREITSRLTRGLSDQIPDLQSRVSHILTNQVFGIAITRLTALLARRTLYCTKNANGQHSIGRGFASSDGNIWFRRIEHSWDGPKCGLCGAPRAIFDRAPDMENHAYAFLHASNVRLHLEALFGDAMQFDVIVGNPPYQMTGGAGGSSDSSIYHLFVEQAIKLEPKYLSMVLPSRWMAGGRGLDEFRATMLNGGKLRSLTDYSDSSEAFPGVSIKGGVCYFLWSADHKGACRVTRVTGGVEHVQADRHLGEFDVFVRDERALQILQKVLAAKEPSILDLVSGDTPFGIATNFAEWSDRPFSRAVALHLISRGRRLTGFIPRDSIRKHADHVDCWKVLVPEAYGAGETFPHQILGQAIVAPPPSVCTQSYLMVAPFQSESEAIHFSTYYRTRLFRFLVSLRKITQHALRSTYSWVPMQTWGISWTDEALYAKYGITPHEASYIESVVRPMGSPEDE